MKNDTLDLNKPSPVKKGKIIPYILSSPLIILLLAVMIVPLLFMFVVSFYKYDAFIGYREIFTLGNYKRFFITPMYVEVIWTTLFISVIVTILSFLLGFPLSYWLARKVVKGRELVLGIVVLPLALSSAVVGFGWSAILGQSGLINRMLMALGFIDAPLKLLFNYPAMIVVLTQVLIPFMVLTLLSTISKIPINLEEAASNLGAPFHLVILKIILPLSFPGILAGALFVFLDAATSFVIPRIIGGGQIQMLGSVVYQQVKQAINFPFASVVATVLVVFTMLFYTLVNSLLRSKYLETMRGKE